MARPDYRLKIKDKARVHVDFAHKRVVISCETDDGELVYLDAAYETIDRIHDEIHKQLEGR